MSDAQVYALLGFAVRCELLGEIDAADEFDGPL